MFYINLRFIVPNAATSLVSCSSVVAVAAVALAPLAVVPHLKEK
jgi:hypothetical protein